MRTAQRTTAAQKSAPVTAVWRDAMRNTKKKRRQTGGIMGRSDIPYAQRLRAKQQFDIGWSREQAARIAMYCWSVAANEVEGIGYTRLVRFNNRFQEIDAEFYGQEIEVSMAHAKSRLAQMGIEISGELLMAPPEGGRTQRQMEVKHNVMQAVQISVICGCIAANDVFGWAKKPLERVRGRAEELTARYAKEGDGWLLKEMERIGFTIMDGRAVAWVNRDGVPVKAPGK